MSERFCLKDSQLFLISSWMYSICSLEWNSLVTVLNKNTHWSLYLGNDISSNEDIDNHFFSKITS